MSPDEGVAPDASNTGFEKAMDISDGKSAFTVWSRFGK